MASAINWFEIPVNDMDRAVNFYNDIFGISLDVFEMTPGFPMAMLPAEDGTGGALIHGEGYVPSMEGSLVYLNGGDDLTAVISRVEAANGTIIMPKMSIGENGFVALFADTEGNKVGLHSPS